LASRFLSTGKHSGISEPFTHLEGTSWKGGATSLLGEGRKNATFSGNTTRFGGKSFGDCGVEKRRGSQKQNVEDHQLVKTSGGKRRGEKLKELPEGKS